MTLPPTSLKAKPKNNSKIPASTKPSNPSSWTRRKSPKAKNTSFSKGKSKPTSTEEKWRASQMRSRTALWT